MILKKEKVEEFENYVQDLFDDIESIKLEQDNEEGFLAQVYNIRKRYLNFWSIEYRNDKETKDVISSIVEKKYGQELKLIDIDANDFIDVVFFKTTSLNTQDRVLYAKQINKFSKTKSKETLFYFGEMLNEKNYDFIDGNELQKSLFTCFHGLKNSDKMELLSNVAIFLQEYSKTKEGFDFISTLKTSSSDTQFDNKPTKQWFKSLFDRMNSYSVSNVINIIEDPNNKNKLSFSSSTQGSGLFDGFYIMKSDNSDITITQSQISATYDHGSNLEGSSVLRHSLSNIAIGLALSENLENVDKQNLEDYILSFNENDEKYYINQENKQLLIMDAINKKLGTNFNSFEGATKELNSNISKYKDKIFGKGEITYDSIQQTIKKTKDNHINVNSYFVAHAPNQNYNDQYYKISTLKNDISLDKSSLLTMEEFKIGVQVAAISSNIGHNMSKIMSDENAFKFFAKNIIFNGVNNKNLINNEKLQEVGLKGIEKIIYKHFLHETPENIYNNQKSLSKMSYVDSLAKLFTSSLNKIDTEAKYNEKMKELGFNNPKPYLDVLDDMSRSRFSDYNLADSFGRIKNHVETQKEAVEAQKEAVEAQKEKVETQKIHLTNKAILCIYAKKEDVLKSIDKEYVELARYIISKDKTIDGLAVELEVSVYRAFIDDINNQKKSKNSFEVDIDHKISDEIDNYRSKKNDKKTNKESKSQPI